ncbi:hypothetical protein D0T84_17390 [Dysgonomonas sp. 521]|uniref:tetratricopeptide repeat protein n=1 Tax=Dysgonomonas sp. 521 TaxID=2302932 RepID=UPI0013D18100|nr:hypothetical protein [Dysgonomonas sp. 521]NDV96673.1 hypothetical protein [Dysgonomonas sp. 521]
MKSLLIFISLWLITYSGLGAQPFSPEIPCQEGINLLPMYGGVAKCAGQLKADEDFFAYCDEHFDDREEASEHYREIGWNYMYGGDLDTAMKRFNHAWLLDEDNAAVYCSFGWLLGKKGKAGEAVPFFEKAVTMEPDDADLLMFVAVGYNELYDSTMDETYHKRALELLNKGLLLEPDNASIQDVINEIGRK